MSAAAAGAIDAVNRDDFQRVFKGTLSEPQAEGLAAAMLDGGLTPVQCAAALTALHLRGESADEIVGFARAVRGRASRLPLDADGLVDTCGTGGDGAGTINISTIAAIVAAGAGCRVAKHGNRAVSGRCGSSDVLSALGICGDLPPASVAECIQSVGIGFLHAPLFHAGLRAVGEVRRELGFRTIFNLIGPAANPALVRRQVIGVALRGLAPRVAEVMRRLGSERVIVVHGTEGLDEISPCGATWVADLQHGAIHEYEIRPEDAGLRSCGLEEIRGGDADENAKHALAILGGQPGGGRTAVLLNAGATIHVAGRAGSIAHGAQLAAESIDSGRAMVVLEQLRAKSRAGAEGGCATRGGDR